MKRIFILVLTLSLVIITPFAQTQQGYVKTKGRMVNGKHVAGKGLPGATVNIHGSNSVGVKKANGLFSFLVTNKSFVVQSVQKKGYTLVDADESCKKYEYSKNPIYLVMETPENLKDDQIASERKIRRSLQKQLHEREVELDSLRKLEEISQKDYQNALDSLYASMYENERLIREMSVRYAKIDYDQIDDFYMLVTTCIENGELAKADSLLRSKGNVEEQAAKLKEKESIISESRKRIEKAAEVLTADKEELAKRCHSFYDKFILQHKYDSAYHYLKIRAALDTMNIKWQEDLDIVLNYLLQDYANALIYKKRIYNLCREKYGEGNVLTIEALMNIAQTCHYAAWEDKAIMYAEIALKSLDDTSTDGQIEKAKIYSFMGEVYGDGFINQTSIALDMYKQSLELVNRLGNHGKEIAAKVHDNLGDLYLLMNDYDKAKHHYFQADSVYSDSANEERTCKTMRKLGSLFLAQNDKERGIDFYKSVILLHIETYGKDPIIANDMRIIANAYSELKDIDNALKYYNDALTIDKNFWGENHSNVGLTYRKMGELFHENQPDKALEYFNLSLRSLIPIYGNNHHEVSQTYRSMGIAYRSKKQYKESIDCFDKARTIDLALYGEDGQRIMVDCAGIGNCYMEIGDFAKACEYLQRAYNISMKNTERNYVVLQKAVLHRLSMAQYELHLMNGDLDKFMEERWIVVDSLNGVDSPQSSILVEYCDWNVESDKSLWNAYKSEKNSEEECLILNGDSIQCRRYGPHLFFRIETVNKAKKKHAITKYRRWRKTSKKR